MVSYEYITAMLIIFLLMSPYLTSTASACFLSGITFQTLETLSPPVTKHWPRRFVRQSNAGLPDARRLAVAPEKTGVQHCVHTYKSHSKAHCRSHREMTLSSLELWFAVAAFDDRWLQSNGRMTGGIGKPKCPEKSAPLLLFLYKLYMGTPLMERRI